MEVKKLIRSLTEISGISGCENAVSGYIRSILEPYAKEITTDSMGNLLCEIFPKSVGKPSVVLDAHIDQIGMIVTHIDDKGFVYISQCGSVDRRTLLAQELIIHGAKNITGIAATAPPHLSTGDESGKSPEIDRIRIDVGMTSDEAKKYIAPGDRVVVKSEFIPLLNGRVAAPALDNRAGVAAVILAVERIVKKFSQKSPDFGLSLLFSVQEETGERGAVVGSFSLEPDIAVSVDVSFGHSSDIEEHKSGKLGGGPMIGIAPVLNRGISKRLIRAAEDRNIPFQLEIMGGETSTNADVIGISKGGVRTGLVSIPLRYMHTPVEVISFDDIENTGRLLSEFVLKITNKPSALKVYENGELVLSGNIRDSASKSENSFLENNLKSNFDDKYLCEDGIFSDFEGESNALDAEKKSLLKRICLPDGVSGFEDNIRDAIIKEIKDLCDVKTDNLGNIIAFKKGRNRSGKKIMLAAHMDEVGMIVRGVNSDGRLLLDTVGGIDARVIFGRSVRVGSESIQGVIGAKPIHLLNADERKNAIPKDKLFIDIGAVDKEDALQYISLGDYVAFDSGFSGFGNNMIKARAADDRVGCALLIELIKSDLEYDTYFAFTVQEEVGLRGAKTASYAIASDYAVIVETTTACDIPGAWEPDTVCKLGGGPVVPFMDMRTIYDRDLYKLAFEIAEKNNIPCQTKTRIAGGNDAGAIHISRNGVKTIAVSLPCRYLHSPYCVINGRDYENTFKLLNILLTKLGI